MRLLIARCILIISLIIVPVVGFTKDMVSKIQESSNLDISTDDLAGQISQQMAAGSKTAIAVNDFVDLEGNVTRLGRFLAEELVTKLFQTQKYRVIERPLLNKALTELKFNLSNLVDPASAKQLGRFLGVDAIVTGTITDLGTRVKVNARLISTETGDVFSAAATTIEKDSEVTELFGVIIENKLTSKHEVSKISQKSENNQSSSSIMNVKNVIRIKENFVNGLPPDWQVHSGTWKVEEDFQVDGEVGGVLSQVDHETIGLITYESFSWINYHLSMDIKKITPIESGISIQIRRKDEKNYYEWNLGEVNRIPAFRSKYSPAQSRIYYIADGIRTEIDFREGVTPFVDGKWFHLDIKLLNDTLSFSFNNTVWHSIKHGGHIGGNIALQTNNISCKFDNVNIITE